MAISRLSRDADMLQHLSVQIWIKSVPGSARETVSACLHDIEASCNGMPKLSILLMMPRKNLLVLSHKVLRLTSSSATGVNNQWFGSLPRLDYWTQVSPNTLVRFHHCPSLEATLPTSKNSSILNLRTKMSFSLSKGIVLQGLVPGEITTQQIVLA